MFVARQKKLLSQVRHFSFVQQDYPYKFGQVTPLERPVLTNEKRATALDWQKYLIDEPDKANLRDGFLQAYRTLLVSLAAQDLDVVHEICENRLHKQFAEAGMT